jgi:very-short-patch-repair endonuclease
MVRIPSPRPLKLFDTERDDEKYQAWRAIWGGSYPEFVVFSELVNLKLEPQVDFLFQASEFGGRNRLGGAVVDFELPFDRIAGRVQGEFWHLGSRKVREHDLIQRLALEGSGWTVVDMLAGEVLKRASTVVKMFTRGEQTATATSAGR